MSKARYTKNGLLIPTDQLKQMGKDFRIQKNKGVLIIESKEHEAARKRLSRLIKQLRNAAQEIGPMNQQDIDNLVNEVREVRAGHC